MVASQNARAGDPTSNLDHGIQAALLGKAEYGSSAMRYHHGTAILAWTPSGMISRLLLLAAIALAPGEPGWCLPSQPHTSQEQAEREKEGLDSLPEDLRRSFRASFSAANLLPAAITAGGAGAASAADEELQDYYGRRERFGTVGDIAGSRFVLAGAFGCVIATGLIAENERLRSTTHRLIQGFIVANAVTYAVKVPVNRKRPDGDSLAFPSGHAANVFTAASILGDAYGPKVSIPLHLFAAFVSLTRLDENRHWVSDSVAGAGIGLLVGHSVLRAAKLRSEPRKAFRLDWMPLIGSDGAGVQVLLSF